MLKVILTKGLPASGKSTWARHLIDSEPGKWKRINKDDLRLMLDNSKWSKKNEEFVLLIRDTLALSALDQGWNVIIDDTNLHPKHEQHIRELAKEKKADFEIKDFTDVPIEECIKRDLQRSQSVGEKVIRDMYNQFLKPAPEKVEYKPGLSDAIICDLDGTLALFGDANPYDRDFTKDQCNKPVYEILHREGVGRVILLVSGRQEKYREQTLEWLRTNGINHGCLFMRPTGDTRKDLIVKREIYDREIKGKCNVVFVLDDRSQVVSMWREMGLTCFQVADGDF